MRILLIGPPNSGKRKFVEELMALPEFKDFRINRNPWDVAKVDQVAVGELSDYRTELYLASHRIMELSRNTDYIFTHSIIDSVAHISARVRALSDLGQLTDQWVHTLVLTTHMLNDSLKYDIVVEFEAPEEEFSFFNREVEESLKVLIKELNLKTIKPDINILLNEIQEFNKSREEAERTDNLESVASE